MNKTLTPLEALKEVKEYNFGGVKDFNKHFVVIETELERLEKQDEILRNIISKRIDFDKLQRCANAYEYNNEVDWENNEEETTRQHITQEEYDSLEKMGLIY